MLPAGARVLPFSLREKVPPYSAADEGSLGILNSPHPSAKICARFGRTAVAKISAEVI